MVTQAQASAFASFQLATLARNTQAPAIAFACSQLAALAQKKRCLGTAPQSLGVFVRCRLRRPLWCQLAQWSRRLRLPPSPAPSSLRSLEIRRLRLPPSPAPSSLRSLRKSGV